MNGDQLFSEELNDELKRVRAVTAADFEPPPSVIRLVGQQALRMMLVIEIALVLAAALFYVLRQG